MGTPEFAVPSLEALVHPDLQNLIQVVGVVTQPDRPKGRGQRLVPPPIKTLAERHGVPVVQPLKIKDPESLETLRQWAPDFIVVTAFGRILPPVILISLRKAVSMSTAPYCHSTAVPRRFNGPSLTAKPKPVSRPC
jgi:methionyl-tRNA formyltransferase